MLQNKFFIGERIRFRDFSNIHKTLKLMTKQEYVIFYNDK